jgi:hypothetical protein
LQWNLPNRTKVFGVSISNEYGISQFNNNTHKNDLVNFEVRAGLRSVSELSDFSPGIHKGKIAINELCGTIEIRGGEDRVYPIICSKSILADYITIQMIDDNAMLQINELEVIKDADSKKKIYIRYFYQYLIAFKSNKLWYFLLRCNYGNIFLL